MSTKQVSCSQIHCNGCGAIYEHVGPRVVVVRARAAADGWRHESRRYEQSNWNQQLDWCPTCASDPTNQRKEP